MIAFHTSGLIVLYLSLVNSSLFPQEKCNSDDCSFQLQPYRNESCFTHNTAVCLQSMLNFTQKPTKKFDSEANAMFDVSILPYLAEKVNGKLNLSAVNISFVIRKEGVKALAIKIISLEKTLCRIFDFSKSKRFLSLPVTLFYDCLYFPPNSPLLNSQMEIIFLPSNEHLTYYVRIPDSNPITNHCDWRPVVMVFGGSLVEGIVKIKFSQAPQQLHIAFYSVELVDKSTNKKITRTISPGKNEDMLTAEIVDVPHGNYAIIVKPSSENCFGSEAVAFQVGRSNETQVKITWTCMGIIILVIICSFAVYKFCILPKKIKGKRRTSNKGFKVLPDDEKDPLTPSSNDDDSNSLTSSSSVSDSDEDLKQQYDEKFI